MKKYPKEKITCAKDRKWVKWYITINGKQRKVLRKSERKRAEILAMKKYLTLQLEELHHKKKAIDLYLKHYNPKMDKAMHLLDADSAYRELLSPFIKTYQEQISSWENEPFQSNPKYNEQRIHTTTSGYNVRSKAEVMIEKALTEHQIPHRYECMLELKNDIVLYPDFTLLNMRKKKVYIWEHFGMMGDKNYIEGTARKMMLYTQNGILPGVNLIMTYETKEQPLTIDTIEKIIQFYFE